MSEKQLKEEIERLQAQLAACSCAALGWTHEALKPGDYGWSASFQDVAELRKKHEEMMSAGEER